MSLFTVTDYDKKVYEEQLRDYLPNKIIDIHTHVWKGAPKPQNPNTPKRTVTWPSLLLQRIRSRISWRHISSISRIRK